MKFVEGQIVQLDGSPDEWVIVTVEKAEITVCHAGMESYQIGVAPEDITQVLGYRDDLGDYYLDADEYVEEEDWDE